MTYNYKFVQGNNTATLVMYDNLLNTRDRLRFALAEGTSNMAQVDQAATPSIDYNIAFQGKLTN